VLAIQQCLDKILLMQFGVESLIIYHYYLKSKGTKRSIQALLSCYGIPQSLISINEYGGPRLERAPLYEKYNFDYALDLSW
jgi:hypothetical protein